MMEPSFGTVSCFLSNRNQISESGQRKDLPKPEILLNNKVKLEPEDNEQSKATDGFEVVGERKKIDLTIKNASSLICSLDLTNQNIQMVKSLYSFETRAGPGIGVASAWELSLRVNPYAVDQTSLNLYLLIQRKPIDASSTTPVPVHTKWEGNIHVFCNGLMNSQNEADRPMQEAFKNIPTKMKATKFGFIHKEYDIAKILGVVTWNRETIDDLRSVGRIHCIDLRVDGYICFSLTGLSQLSPIQNPLEKRDKTNFVDQTKKEWLQMGSSMYRNAYSSSTDVKIVFPKGQANIDAHRCILAAFSPVFRQMFETEMIELKTGEIKIEDVSRKAMFCALRFMYTGSLVAVSNPYENALSTWCKYAEEMAYIAEKYQIDCLKQFCDNNLSRKCTKENAFELFEIAQLFGLEVAIEQISIFIKNNLEMECSFMEKQD